MENRTDIASGWKKVWIGGALEYGVSIGGKWRDRGLGKKTGISDISRMSYQHSALENLRNLQGDLS